MREETKERKEASKLDFRSKRAAESILREIWLDIEEIEMPVRRYVQDVSTDIFNDDDVTLEADLCDLYANALQMKHHLERLCDKSKQFWQIIKEEQE